MLVSHTTHRNDVPNNLMFFDKLGHGDKKNQHPLNVKSKKTQHSVTVKVVKSTGKDDVVPSKGRKLKSDSIPSASTHRKKIKSMDRLKSSSIVDDRYHPHSGYASNGDEDEDEDEGDWEANMKRLSRKGTPGVKSSSRAWTRQLFLHQTGTVADISGFITCAQCIESDINMYEPLFAGSSENQVRSLEIELPYGFEEIPLVEPKSGENASLNPMKEMCSFMELTAEFFLPRDIGIQIKDPTMKDCIMRQINLSLQQHDLAKLQDTVIKYNAIVKSAREDLSIQSQIEDCLGKQMPLQFKLVNEILTQTYVRTVSKHVDDLRKYKAFSSNVYGELLPRFASTIFQETNMTDKDVFIDLGSGVGNCVLQAAIEVGCHSIGCEIMTRAAELAAHQKEELEARTRRYGLKLGKIELEQGDFVDNKNIQSLIGHANVILVNNYAFSAELNESLLNMFLDLRDGTRVVSLRSFVPDGHVMTERNMESPLNILSVQKKFIPQNSVSWTDASGEYFIATVDRR